MCVKSAPVRPRRHVSDYLDNVGTAIRDQGPGYFHVFTRATGGGALVVDEADRRHLVHLLATTADRLGWALLAYCVMTTHYHAVVQTTRPNLSRGMQRINSTYARTFNQRYGRFGTLVACRFGYRIVEEEHYLEEVCRYVFMNPVRARITETAEAWPWNGGVLLAAALAA
jgi:putative transposase